MTFPGFLIFLPPNPPRREGVRERGRDGEGGRDEGRVGGWEG